MSDRCCVHTNNPNGEKGDLSDFDHDHDHDYWCQMGWVWQGLSVSEAADSMFSHTEFTQNGKKNFF